MFLLSSTASREVKQMRNESVRDLEFEAGLNEFFELIFKKLEAGEMTFEDAKRFFPKEVKDRAKEAATE